MKKYVLYISVVSLNNRIIDNQSETKLEFKGPSSRRCEKLVRLEDSRDKTKDWGNKNLDNHQKIFYPSTMPTSSPIVTHVGNLI